MLCVSNPKSYLQVDRHVFKSAILTFDSKITQCCIFTIALLCYRFILFSCVSSHNGGLLMKSRLLGLLAATALSTVAVSVASAADLPAVTAPPAPIIAAPIFTLSGFYAGVNA